MYGVYWYSKKYIVSNVTCGYDYSGEFSFKP